MMVYVCDICGKTVLNEWMVSVTLWLVQRNYHVGCLYLDVQPLVAELKRRLETLRGLEAAAK